MQGDRPENQSLFKLTVVQSSCKALASATTLLRLQVISVLWVVNAPNIGQHLALL